MNLSLPELLDSKIYVRNNMNFMPPKDLVNNFLDSIKFDNITPLGIKAQNPIINQNIEGTENIAYPRFLVEMRKGNSPIQNEINVFGMIVAMDQTKPIVKVYSGMNASACMNLSIFNASNVFTQDLTSNLSNIWNKAKDYFLTEDEKFQRHQETIKKLNETVLGINEVDRMLGNLLRRSQHTPLGTTPIVGASQLISDRKSMYYIEPTKPTTLNNIFNAITQNITDSKDLLSKPNKTIAAAHLLELLN